MFGKAFRILTIAAALGIGTALPAQAGMYARHAESITPSINVAQPPAAASVSLSAEEVADLTFMREEEKLARDLYLAFDEQWGGTTFGLIAGAEQRHMNAILRLLVKYQLPDPAAGNLIGEFSDMDIQAMHDEFLADGLASELAALNVGGLVEEIDIADNIEAASGATQENLVRVYEALTCGSRNHLRAFAGRIVALTGVPYVAQFLPQADVDAIVQQPFERCGWH
jgi:hypothetical protein